MASDDVIDIKWAKWFTLWVLTAGFTLCYGCYSCIGCMERSAIRDAEVKAKQPIHNITCMECPDAK